MSITWKIPRNCLAWLLLAQLFLLAPHVQRLPLWVLGTYVVCACWRIMVFQGRWSFPHRLIKFLLALACFAGIYRSYGSFVGLEATVALLFSGFSLKLLEVATKRDVYVIIFLAYFVALTEFLFSQDFLIVCLVFLSIILVSTALVALHQQRYDQLNTISLRKAAVLFAQAVPLMVVLFMVFPRFEPLWQVPLASHQAKTGITDTLSPGDISELTQSGELAFRVHFDGDVPPVTQLYWRALVFSTFDGRRWQRNEHSAGALSGHLKRERQQHINNRLRYTVIQEATHQPWLFSLALASSDTSGVQMMSDFRLQQVQDIHTRITYDVVSDTSAVLEPDLDMPSYLRETLLPDEGDPKARQFATALYNQSSDINDYINRVLTYFRDEPFVYTLKPPLLGRNTIDDFLFTTRKGFCSHYASSFVFLMRAVGIAARVVAGYQGGEINPITGSVLVHQFDAHAWAEVWTGKEGWVRIDPTAVVSPQRIERGLQDAMAAQGGFLERDLLSPLRYRDIAWLNRLRLRADALRYYWHSAVLQYQGKQQFELLRALLGEVTPWRIAALLLVVGAVVLLSVAAGLFRGRGQAKRPGAVRVYLRLCQRLEAAGFKRAGDEGAIDFARRVTNKEQRWGRHFLAATRAFVALSYEPVDKKDKTVLLKQLKRESLKVSYYLHKK